MQRSYILLLATLLAPCLGSAAELASMDAVFLSVPTGSSASTSRLSLFHWNSDTPEEGGPPSWDEPLASDRPDFTEASCTVGRGRSQLEMGYTYFLDDTATVRSSSHSFPEMLLRIGIAADWLEFRIAWNYSRETTSTPFGGATAQGFEDLYAGAKIGLTLQQGFLPEMAVVPQMTIPMGSNVSSNRVLPGINWLYAWEVNDFISTAGSSQLNFAVDPVTESEFTEFAQSWTIGYTLTDRLGGYTEWFVLVPTGADTARTEHYLNAGLTLRITNNVQLDIRAGKGVSSAAVDRFAGGGAVLRF
ncbi:transporter [Anatilimnocola sp. NA78]|uniref:transporter n=1 Tax=Anatilimnocola sp. NA78 TaxID=3415683 RepID=UPI003CE581D9